MMKKWRKFRSYIDHFYRYILIWNIIRNISNCDGSIEFVNENLMLKYALSLREIERCFKFVIYFGR